MHHDPLDYPSLLQDALRGLVRRCLEIVAEQGFSGEHHFFLSFDTRAPGVVLPPHLLEQYPEEMTIVLKSQFRDLAVDTEAFSVGLFFAGVAHYLTIPFDALLSFVDPSAEFQLVFQTPSPAEAVPESEVPSVPRAVESDPTPSDAAADTPSDNVVSLAGFRKRQ